MSSEIQFYKDLLFNDILAFWEKYAPDEEFGGFFTCFTNNGGELISEDKYIWSQGRILWCLSRLLSRPEISGKRRENILRWADKTASFLMNHARLENGNCVFLTDRCGTHKESGGVLDASIYADCFVILGTAEYARTRNSNEALNFSYDLYLNCKERYESRSFRTDPYPEPKGYKTHGIPMIFTNTSRTLSDAMAALSHPDAEAVALDAYGFAKEVIDNFVDENEVLHEMVHTDGSFDFDTLLGRYINPGHTIEDCWFMYMEWERFADKARMEKTLKVLKNALRLGWDDECGGITLFTDHKGECGSGSIPNPAEPMVKKVQNDSFSKLWWVHSEALYTTLLFSYDEEVAAWHEKIKDYTFKTFPNKENERGEWIQIRDREGKPENRIVALPVKDPFHIMRNIILIIEELERRGA